jgi:hypothetical protein
MGKKIESYALPVAVIFAVIAVLAGAFGFVMTGMMLGVESEMHAVAVKSADADAAASADRARVRGELLACISRSIQAMLVVIGAAAFIFLIVISSLKPRGKTSEPAGDDLDNQFERY